MTADRDPKLVKKVEDAVEFYNLNSSDRLRKLTKMVTEILESELAQHKILARVASRVKAPESLRNKLLKWSDHPKKRIRIKSPEQTLKHISDLAAVRVMTYTEHDRERVQKIVESAFRSPDGVENFETERKEESESRIKDDPKNHYRATHMRIALRNDDASEKDRAGKDDSNLSKDQCELQITSMLAHVWNEIEHDTQYKKMSGELSPEEEAAIDSLGLLTKTGDNIIESLLQSRRSRELKEAQASKRFADERTLAAFLKAHFGAKVADEKMNYDESARELLATLQAIHWDHPLEVALKLSPGHLHEAKSLAKKVQKHQNANEKSRSLCNIASCDLLLIAIFMKHDPAALKEVFEAKKWHGNARQVSLLKAYSAITK